MSTVSIDQTIAIKFTLNGKAVDVRVSLDASLTRVLRDCLDQTDTKIGCEVGRCGACMVLMNGQAINSCLVMAWQAEGAEIVTGRGLDERSSVKIIRQALAEESAFQCGYCAPGFVLSLVALFAGRPDATKDEITTALKGNICRCTGYHSILRGALLAAERLRTNPQDAP